MTDNKAPVTVGKFHRSWHVPSFLHLSKKWLIVAAVLLVVVAGAVAGWFAWRHQGAVPKPNFASVNTVPADMPPSQFKYYQSQLVAAQKAITDTPTPKTAADKKALAQKYITLGAAYANLNDIKDATTAYNMAKTVSSVYADATTESLAGLYAQAGNYQKSIGILQQLVAQAKSHPDQYQPIDVQSWQTQIKFWQQEQGQQ